LEGLDDGRWSLGILFWNQAEEQEGGPEQEYAESGGAPHADGSCGGVVGRAGCMLSELIVCVVLRFVGGKGNRGDRWLSELKQTRIHVVLNLPPQPAFQQSKHHARNACLSNFFKLA